MADWRMPTFGNLVDWGILLLIVAVALAAALFVHAVLFAVLRRLASRSASGLDDKLLVRMRSPARWIMVAIALGLAARMPEIPQGMAAAWQGLMSFVTPALVGWLALALLWFVRDVGNARADITAADNLSARRRRTRIAILARIGTFAIIFLTISMILLSIPGVKSVGVTLMASAGLAGLAIGAAAQPALKNLIAGVQMAFTEPIRIDDVVIVNGEWGRIEEIRLTYVVVKIWDERRLVVPVSYFLENSFQNWTRETSELLGTAFLYLDPTADVARVRSRLAEIVRDNPNWDGRVSGLQVTDIKPDVMEVRALVSAADAGKAFDLRCDVREAMMAYIRDEMPEALPRQRNEVSGGLIPRNGG